DTIVEHHPYVSPGRERQDYKTLGETGYLDQRWHQFWSAVQADPRTFFERTAHRFAAATFWYEPFDRAESAERPLVCWLGRLIHPLPFLGMLVLVCTAFRVRLHKTQWIVIAIYCWYLLPYVAISYYDRYAAPLLGLKALLVIWGTDRLVSLRWMDKTDCNPGEVPLRL